MKEEIERERRALAGRFREVEMQITNKELEIMAFVTVLENKKAQK